MVQFIFFGKTVCHEIIQMCIKWHSNSKNQTDQVSKVYKGNIKRKSAESCLDWLESDEIGIISGLVEVEFQKFVSVL